jgi:hypothetical protein
MSTDHSQTDATPPADFQVAAAEPDDPAMRSAEDQWTDEIEQLMTSLNSPELISLRHLFNMC